MNDTVGRGNPAKLKNFSLHVHFLPRYDDVISLDKLRYSRSQRQSRGICLFVCFCFRFFCFCFVFVFCFCFVWCCFFSCVEFCFCFVLFCFLTKAQSYIDRGRPWTSPLELFFDSLQLSVSFSIQDVGKTVSSFTTQNTPALQATSVASLMRRDIGNNTIMNSLDTLVLQ